MNLQHQNHFFIPEKSRYNWRVKDIFFHIVELLLLLCNTSMLLPSSLAFKDLYVRFKNLSSKFHEAEL